jgi:GTP cyclohydrolase I
MQQDQVVPEDAIENVVDLHRWPVRPRDVTADEWSRFDGYMGEIFAAFGMDLDTPGTRDTPGRFLEALYAATAGYDGDAKLSTVFPSESRGGREGGLAQIVEGPISFHALCEHHALPFHGVAYVGYVAADRIIGISKLTRIVRLYARRFTVQERMGEQIADTLVELVAPRGVAVHLTAEHLCTHMRGVEEASSTITTFWRGSFQDPDLRREFLDEVRGRLRA